MSTVYRRLRHAYPWLTPTYAGDDGYNDLRHRPRLPRGLEMLPAAGDGGDLRIPPLRRERPIETTADIVPTIPMRRIPLESMAEPPAPPILTRRASDSIAAPLIDPNLVESLTSRMPALINPDERITDDRLAEIGAPPMVIRRDGRPTTKFIGEGTPEERLTTRRRALEEYEPQKESKKSLLFRTLLGQLRGGLIGEGGSLDTLLGAGGVLDRRGKDRAWQQGQLAQTDEQLGRLRTDRRQVLQDDLLAAQVQRAQSPPPLKEPNLIRIPDPNNPNADILVPERPNLQIPLRDKPTPEKPPLMKLVTYSDGSTGWSKSDDNGKTWTEVPELRGAPKPEPLDTAPFTNENLQRNISEAESEKKKVAAAIANTAEFLDQFNEKPNPIHQSLKARERELDDKIRAWRADMKAPRLTRSNATRNSGGVTEQQIRDAAKAKNLDPDQAVKRARARGMIR